jgi:pyruvate/2-oxoglutarate dehydrogenase complex dihydrolipoamide acyltransferase (E2) component
MSLVEVKVPDIGDFDEVAVIELLVKPGDTIKAEQSLVTVESDKASMEIPSTHAGVVKELKVKLGDKVKQGSLLAVLESTTQSSPSAQPGSGGGGPHPNPPPARGRGQDPWPLCQWRPPRVPMPAAPISNATCWCSAPAPVAIRPPSVPPISA